MTTTRKAFLVTALLAPALLLAQAPPGEIAGKVTFVGTPPKNKTLKLDADPVCAALHPTPVIGEDVLVGSGGALRNVLVYVKAGLPAATATPSPPESVKVDQKGCIYTPRIVVAMVGQPIAFTNSDDTDHHIQAMAEVNKEWMVSQKKGAPAQVKTFDKEEIGMLVICHLHPWMRMFVHVLKNPYYAVTGADGTFTLKGLPAGTYTLEAWHERFGTKTLKVQAGGKADFTFKDQ